MRHERDIHEIPAHHPIFTRLTEARMAWQLPLEDVATRMGIQTDTLRKYELGIKLPSLPALLRWADVLGFDVSLWPKG